MEEKERTIDFNSRTQLYYQMFDILMEGISSGKYRPGDMLPTENELIAKYGVSRVTVRKAMDMLLHEGLISKRRGYGTYVNEKKIEQNLSSVIHFTESMQSQGQKTSTVMLQNVVEYADKTIAEALGIPEDTKMIRVDRLRMANDRPMCVECSYLIYESCPDVLGMDFNTASLRQTLRKMYNIVWKHAKQKIMAVAAPADIAQHLQIHKGAAVLYIERVTYSQDDLPLEFLKTYYRGDKYYMTADLSM